MARQTPVGRPAGSFFVLSAAVLATLGCSESPGDLNPPPETARPISAEVLIERMRRAYQGLESYAGSAEVVEVAVRRGEGVERELPYYTIAWAYQRPDRLRFVLEELTPSPDEAVRFEVATGGELVYAMAAEAPGQVHVARAPEQLTIDNFITAPAMKEAVFQVGPENYFPHLVMLLESSSDEPLFAGDANPRRLPSKRLGRHTCYRVELDNPAGRRVLWINERTMLLERVEVPSETLRAEMDPEGLYSHLKILVDFDNEQVNTPIDPAVFSLEAAADARPVRRFVEPPPAGLPELLGKRIGAVELETLDGESFVGEQLAGKTTLLDIWFTSCVPCEQEMPRIEETWQTLGDEQLQCYAISIDPESVPDDHVQATLQAWGGTMPILRDPQRSVLEQFGIEGTPTTVLVDAQGRVQYVHQGVHRSAATLIDAARSVLQGVDLAKARREAYAKAVAEYEQELDAATIDVEQLASRPGATVE